VPWCPACDRFLSPSTVRVDGSCPSCGRVVDAGRAHRPATAVDPERAPAPPTVEDPPEPVPWHLKLLLVALAVYLAYRAFQGVAWVVAHL
jgi:hypothetical protein